MARHVTHPRTEGQVIYASYVAPGRQRGLERGGILTGTRQTVEQQLTYNYRNIDYVRTYTQCTHVAMLPVMCRVC